MTETVAEKHVNYEEDCEGNKCMLKEQRCTTNMTVTGVVDVGKEKLCGGEASHRARRLVPNFLQILALTKSFLWGPPCCSSSR